MHTITRIAAPAVVVEQLGSWFHRWRSILALLVAVQFVAYTYFFTSVIFSNHSFPNAYVAPYPSYKTRAEGRFISDLIVAAQGGSGVQSFQMCLAAAVQAVNGVLLARLLRLRSRVEVFLVAVLLALAPYFLDYYAYSIDTLAFCLGDCFALLGATLFLGKHDRVTRAAGTTLLYGLTIATYQPKIAVVSLLAILALLLKSGDVGPDQSPAAARRSLFAEAVMAGGCVLVATVAYWICFKLTADQSDLVANRTHLNSLAQMVTEAKRAFVVVPRQLLGDVPGIPGLVQKLLAAGVVGGIGACLYRAWKQSWFALAISAACLLVIPLSLRSPYILNSHSWSGAGRIMAASAYCISFFIGCGLGMQWFRPFAIGIGAVVSWFFLVLASQQTNALAYKTLFELNQLNRIVDRVEQLPDLPSQSPVPIVVLGQQPGFPFTHYVRNPVPPSLANTAIRSFEVFRQLEFLNYYVGRTAFRPPTKTELGSALASAAAGGRPAWPATESVYLHDGTVVVLLSPYREGILATWPVGP
jgi:hypothetical protein